MTSSLLLLISALTPFNFESSPKECGINGTIQERLNHCNEDRGDHASIVSRFLVDGSFVEYVLDTSSSTIWGPQATAETIAMLQQEYSLTYEHEGQILPDFQQAAARFCHLLNEDSIPPLNLAQWRLPQEEGRDREILDPISNEVLFAFNPQNEAYYDNPAFRAHIPELQEQLLWTSTINYAEDYPNEGWIYNGRHDELTTALRERNNIGARCILQI